MLKKEETPSKINDSLCIVTQASQSLSTQTNWLLNVEHRALKKVEKVMGRSGVRLAVIHRGEQACNATSSQPCHRARPTWGHVQPLLPIDCIQAGRIQSKAGKAVQLPKFALMERIRCSFPPCSQTGT